MRGLALTTGMRIFLFICSLVVLVPTGLAAETSQEPDAISIMKSEGAYLTIIVPQNVGCPFLL